MTPLVVSIVVINNSLMAVNVTFDYISWASTSRPRRSIHSFFIFISFSCVKTADIPFPQQIFIVYSSRLHGGVFLNSK